MWSHPAPKWILREFDVSRIRPRLAWVTSPWNVDMAKFDLSWEGYLVWQTGLPTLKGDPTYHVNVIKLKWEIIWTGGLPQLSGRPCLPGPPPPRCEQALKVSPAPSTVSAVKLFTIYQLSQYCTTGVSLLRLDKLLLFLDMSAAVPNVEASW